VWDVTVAIAAGGALGALGRYGLSEKLPHPPDGFPSSTFVVNVSGCFLIGVLMVVLTEGAGRPHRLFRPFLGVGVLGGFTTFSTYTVETQQLVTAGAPRLAFGYLLGTLAAALVAAQIGIMVTRVLTRARRRKGAAR
jgi:CrcB protein